MNYRTQKIILILICLTAYSVKYAYRVLTTHLSTTLPNHNLALWKKIWSIKLPPKVKNFLWRVCSHCLPTKDRLIQRKLNVDPTCPVCATEMETSLHVFTQCRFAKNYWLAAQLSQPSENLQSITDWVFHILEFKNVDSRQLGCMILCAIWHHRHEVLWNNHTKSPARLLNFASSFLFQWKAAQFLPKGDNLPSEANGKFVWEKPPFGWIKCNADGAVFSEQRKLGYDWIVVTL